MTDKDVFAREDTYKLYRSVKDIIKPVISKKNISDYKIVFNDNLLPVRVFYPKKVSNIEKVILFIHGNSEVTGCDNYFDVCKDLAVEVDHLVIAYDFFEIKEKGWNYLYDKIYDLTKYLYKELEKVGIKNENIVILGESTGGNIACKMVEEAKKKKEFEIQKEILMYPTLSLEYFGKSQFESLQEKDNNDLVLKAKLKKYFKEICSDKQLEEKILNTLNYNNYKNYPTTLVVVGNSDILRDEALYYYKNLEKEKKDNKYLEIPFANHGFLSSTDKEIKNELYVGLKEFLG